MFVPTGLSFLSKLFEARNKKKKFPVAQKILFKSLLENELNEA